MDITKEIADRQLYTLKTLKTPNAGRILAKWLFGICVVAFILLFLPWQQNIRGTGTITAFTPGNRPQSIESTIAGRISGWKIREGQYVNKGDTILTLSEVKDKFFDPNLLLRLNEQVEAKQSSIYSKRDKITALRNQISALNQALNLKYSQAENKVIQTELKLTSDSVDYLSEKVRYSNFENQFDRNKKLYEAGNIALTKFQDIESKFQQARMKVVSTENKFLQSKSELINSRINLSSIRAEYRDKISKAESTLNSTLSETFDAEASLSKLKNEFANMQIRNSQYQVIAPQAGYIVKAIRAGIGETIKEGEAVVTIMPANPDMAIEIYVKAMDIPLISKGRKVRIEFDGWPALQFSGWPSSSVGTFGGEVQVIDYVNSAGGDFRLLITPDPEDEPWPEYIRLGSGAKGWVMLDNVPIWYELWRQLNGFPPSLYEHPLKDELDKKEKNKKK